MKKLTPQTICLTMIVKNESKIIERCLDAASTVINFICITDTGSTDNTKALITLWAKKKNMPCKLYDEPFINFEFNRTKSLKNAKEAFPHANYFLLIDADMILENHGFNKKLLFENAYLLQQYNDDTSHQNIRLIKNDKYEWECIGVTHEYWDTENEEDNTKVSKVSIKTLRIYDKGDGGAKMDKYERDKRLLLKGLEGPFKRKLLETRYLFYLGNTLRTLREYDDAIKYYLLRIEKGGWIEEIFESYFAIGLCYEGKWNNVKAMIESKESILRSQETAKVVDEEKEKEFKNEVEQLNIKKKEIYEKALEYLLKGYEIHPQRGESLQKMCQLLREEKRYREAYDYAVIGKKIPFPTSDKLFINPQVYNFLFDFEISVAAFYLPDKKKEGEEAVETLLSRDDLPEHLRQITIGNAKHYL